jgi:hypothetical protein
MGVFQVKTVYSLYHEKSLFNYLYQACLTEVHIILEGTHPNEQCIMALGYHYSIKSYFVFWMKVRAQQKLECHYMKLPTEIFVGVQLLILLNPTALTSIIMFNRSSSPWRSIG